MRIINAVNSLKYQFILTSLVMIFVFGISDAGADVYVIAGSRGVGKEIKLLPFTISAPGFYYITGDLSCPAGSHGITVMADDVTIDLMGFSLVGSGGTGGDSGIYMGGRANVEIRNGTVRNFANNGVHESNSEGEGHRIINIRVKGNQAKGISLLGKGHQVQNCTAANNLSHGIHTPVGSAISGNTCYGNFKCGIFAITGSSVKDNTCYNNGQGGIYTVSGPGSTVTGNTCFNNTGYGIFLGGNSLVDQNTAYNNAIANISSCSSCTFGKNSPSVP